jgi:hypothetical protein
MAGAKEHIGGATASSAAGLFLRKGCLYTSECNILNDLELYFEKIHYLEEQG